MQSSPCHAPAAPEQEISDARDLILRVLTVRKVARWCDVSESAVHQWLRRGSAEAPVPVKVVPTIAKHASDDGLDFDLGLLCPAMSGMSSGTFAQARP